ncbi:hypothetical protein EHYA_03818 [Embleya hyalina]|uniref:Uncharacterized protein n=1 Tax=Embleya hyalina TaxID=516124 RepID=A0A401YNE0_9ACTN|nr:hypothetical protein EHYA_03818 [Embleya hyalina]
MRSLMPNSPGPGTVPFAPPAFVGEPVEAADTTGVHPDRFRCRLRRVVVVIGGTDVDDGETCCAAVPRLRPVSSTRGHRAGRTDGDASGTANLPADDA